MALSDEQIAVLQDVQEMLQVRMRELPRRYQHSLGVARTAVELARAYGVDEYHAALAGLVHDWDKVLDDHELLARAAQYGVRVSGSPTLAAGLLHGPVAAHELPHIFEGISAEVVNMHTIKPLDTETLFASAAKTGRVVTVEEHSVIGGLGEAVCAALCEHTPVRVKRVGVQDVYGESGPALDLLDKYGLNAEGIAFAVREVLA